MNLDKIGPPDGPEYLAPPEWTINVHREGSQSVGVVMLRLQPMCRLSIASPEGGEEAARTALANKARHWIHDYLNRPTSSH
jgi:hypothetical protein